MKEVKRLFVLITAWLSFLISIWLWLFRIVDWQGPALFLILTFIVFTIDSQSTEEKKFRSHLG